VATWNKLVARKFIAGSSLDPQKAISIPDPDLTGDLASVAQPRGFRPVFFPSTDVEATPLSAPPGIRIAFSGHQPETCDFLMQLIPVLTEQNYRFTFEYQTTGVKQKSGVRWKVLRATNDQNLQPDSAYLLSEEWHPGEVRFSTGNADLVRLVLAYARPAGTTRAEGSISMRKLRLEFAQ
jgi:hypothetical protein